MLHCDQKQSGGDFMSEGESLKRLHSFSQGGVRGEIFTPETKRRVLGSAHGRRRTGTASIRAPLQGGCSNPRRPASPDVRGRPFLAEAATESLESRGLGRRLG